MSIPRPPASVHALRQAVLVFAAALAFAARVDAGPTVACAGGPDPLRFRPETALAAVSSAPEPIAVDACVDPGTGREWIAVAFLDPAGIVSVIVGDGGCTFAAGSGGLAPTAVSTAVVSSAPAVALRVDGGVPLLAIAWREGDAVVVRSTGALDGTFSAPATLETSARSPPASPSRRSLASPRSAPHRSRTSRAVASCARASRRTWSIPRAWPPASTLNGTLGPDLGAGAEIALAADAAGTRGPAFTLLATVESSGAAHVARADDVLVGFGSWRRADDLSLVRPLAPELASAAGGTSAWTALAWQGRSRGAPPSERVAADSALVDVGGVVSDFEGVVGSPTPVQATGVAAAARVAVAVSGAAPGVTSTIALESGGEIHVHGRPLGSGRPHLAGGCGDFQLTGTSPARGSGTARAPVAHGLAGDVVVAFVDDRNGVREAWLKRSDSTPPLAGITRTTAAACGPPPRVQVDWLAPCDAVSLVLEVGTATGGTDFTRDATGLTGLLVEGLRPGTQYFFRIRATDSAGNVGVSPESSATTSACASQDLVSTVLTASDGCAAGGSASGDGRVDPGETSLVRVRVTNSGTATAPGVTLRAQSRATWLTVRSPTAMLGDIAPGAFADANVIVDVSATAPCNRAEEMLLRADSGGFGWGDLVGLSVGPPCTPCLTSGCSTVADASLTNPRAICAGAQVTLDAGASTSANCPGALSYEWWDGGTLLSTAPSFNRNPGGTTTFRLVAKCSTDFACTSETTVLVTVNPLPVITFVESPPPPHCEGDVVTITATTSDPAATFTWADGPSGPSRTVSAATPLQVTVRDSNGCTRNANTRVEFGVVPPADAGPDVVGCGGVLVGTPGFPQLDYRWDPPTGLSSRWIAQPLASPATPTTYTLTVTDPTSGCSATDTVDVAAGTGPGPVADLMLTRSGSDVVFRWTDPAGSLLTRIYRDLSARDAAHANGASATARLECEAVATCSAPLGPERLVFYQAVSVCLDGIGEGPN